MPVVAKRLAVSNEEKKSDQQSSPHARAREGYIERVADQLAGDRAEAQRVLALIGRGIDAWQTRGLEWSGFVPDAPPSEWRGLHKLCYLLAQLFWLEHRITQTDMMATLLWCPGCEGDGRPEDAMQFECLAHAEVQNMRSAMALGMSLFGGAS